MVVLLYANRFMSLLFYLYKLIKCTKCAFKFFSEHFMLENWYCIWVDFEESTSINFLVDIKYL